MALKTVSCAVAVVLLSVGYYQYKITGSFLSFRERQPQKNVMSLMFLEGSSLNCSGSGQTLTCKFRNLCYLHAEDAFVYVFSSDSKEVLTLTDELKRSLELPLTSVTDLSYPMRYINVTGEFISRYIQEKDFVFKPGKYIIYSRYVANNLFHLFHDEFLPLFFTLQRYFEEEDFSSIKLFIKDKVDEGDFNFLYDLFSSDTPIFSYELSLETGRTLVCFEEATIGLLRESTWYQYGFKEPEGPIKHSTATSEHIRQFTIYFKQKLEIYPQCCRKNIGIILSRKRNRLLLNEQELGKAISEKYQIEMIEVSLESTSFPHIIEKVSCAKLLVGVHGALLIVGMFLPPYSVLLEIFPYAINPDHRTHYKTLTQLPGMDIKYASWRNMDKSKTVTHGNVDPLGGGISHLNISEQQRIMNLKEVPHNKRGSDPEWRFYLYQDTIVDIPAVVDVLTNIGFERVLSKDGFERVLSKGVCED